MRKYQYTTELEAAIIDCLSKSSKALSRLEIARKLNRSKSPHLIYCIERLVEDGLIIKTQGTTVRKKPCWLYSL